MTHSESTAAPHTPAPPSERVPRETTAPERGSLTGRRTAVGEWVAESSLLIISLVSILVLGLIMLFLILEGTPTFSFVSVKEFIGGVLWYPTDEPPAFGILALIVGSFAVTMLSSLISVPSGVMTAIYLSEIAPPRVAEWLKPAIELLASLPSVVIGFFGMVAVAPLMQTLFDIPTGLNLFTASIMLAFMSIPTICTISEDALRSVPITYREASLALGATPFETISRVTVPAALSGITTAIILGMSRAIGETMVVLMVAGGAAMVPESLFDPIRPMPASIASEMGEAPFRGEHYHALFATGITLFLFTIVFNVLAMSVSRRYRLKG
ncbi:phosphate ABC transporter permease subunit PstC [Desulfoluna spongiiphila]|uniref:Phosphate transport system permease protein n=1 Tax=Desulfoluna spongiiphila TaxID=419481 RepID=A0A1G5GW23_9BACT|nr:phosphate ABC transporter permease subunit PstC [Desulfoluna spongiiphila]SCY55591.1 phosphate ABC transporter membrane protein 1, PhoT family [Desulfoluna spongiiphila]VVS92942.1 phosphate abc transporter permease protein pstc [Desulfoluna spongiiphila]